MLFRPHQCLFATATFPYYKTIEMYMDVQLFEGSISHMTKVLIVH